MQTVIIFKQEAILANIEIKINRVTKAKTHKIAVVKNLTASMLLGLELMKIFEINIDTGSSTISFKKNSIEKGIRTIKDENLAPRSVHIIKAKANIVGTIMTSPYNFSNMVILGNTISEVINNETDVLIINNAEKALHIRKNTQVASFEKLSQDAGKVENQVVKSINNVIQLKGTAA